jgi:two-component system sensor histidine kinase KdpD
MSSTKQLFLSVWMRQHHLGHYLVDSFLVLAGITLLTGFISFFHLSAKISDSVLLYLITILAFASFRGLYAAICASCLAFVSFDYFFVPPIYGLITHKLEDLLALFVFLATAIITSQLAWALRKRADGASRREHETHILYELMRATNSEEDVPHQLAIFTQSLVEVFSPLGVRNCMVLLPEKDGALIPYASSQRESHALTLLPAEAYAAAWVQDQGCTADLWNSILLPRKRMNAPAQLQARAPLSTTGGCHYLRLIPLKGGKHVVGVLYLLIEDEFASTSAANRLGIEQAHPSQQAVFFSTFLEQAVTVIERGRLRAENLRMEVLEQTDALRASLLSSVSHDLRTPLSAIKTSATSLRQEELHRDQDALLDLATNIEREADRLNRLVENLLDMSRIEGGVLSPEKVWYPLDELVHDVLSRMEAQLQERTVRTCIPDDLPPVKLDYVQIDQVMTNLIENVLHYTPADSPLEVSIQLCQSHIMVGVADRGPGIAQGDREHIFDKFYRVRSERQGFGLGLAVCHGIIVAHGGQIWVEAREGGGSTFYFTLPWEPLEGRER